MCEIHVDSLFVMWAIGGAFLGWAGMKAYKKYSSKNNIADTKTDDTPNTNSS